MDKDGNPSRVPLRSKNNRINMPMVRFREKKRTIAGEDRDGSEVIRAGFLDFYHQHGFDPVASGRSTKGFLRDLKPWEAREVKEVRLGNTADFGGRAGDRAVNDEKRKEGLEKTVKSIQNAKEKQAAKGQATASKHPSQDREGYADDSGTASNKRVYQHLDLFRQTLCREIWAKA